MSGRADYLEGAVRGVAEHARDDAPLLERLAVGAVRRARPRAAERVQERRCGHGHGTVSARSSRATPGLYMVRTVVVLGDLARLLLELVKVVRRVDRRGLVAVYVGHEGRPRLWRGLAVLEGCAEGHRGALGSGIARVSSEGNWGHLGVGCTSRDASAGECGEEVRGPVGVDPEWERRFYTSIAAGCQLDDGPVGRERRPSRVHSFRFLRAVSGRGSSCARGFGVFGAPA